MFKIKATWGYVGHSCFFHCLYFCLSKVNQPAPPSSKWGDKCPITDAFDRLKLEAMPPGLRLEAGLHGIRIRIFQFNMKVSFGNGKNRETDIEDGNLQG